MLFTEQQLIELEVLDAERFARDEQDQEADEKARLQMRRIDQRMDVLCREESNLTGQAFRDNRAEQRSLTERYKQLRDSLTYQY